MAAPKMNQNYGTGRRKTAKARVFIRQGQGKIIINNRSLEDYFGRDTSRMIVRQPLVTLDIQNKFDLLITVCGGGGSGQAGAIRHGIARALLDYDEAGGSPSAIVNGLTWRQLLRRAGFVTRDPRVVERKKIGLHKARKAPQYSKR